MVTPACPHAIALYVLRALCALTLLLALPRAARAEPEQVIVGAYLNDVQNIDLKMHSYTVDLYIWFRWTNEELDPATTLGFINPNELWGHVSTKDYEEGPIKLESGELYQVMRVQGRFSKKLPLYNYPFDRQTLAVVFEDSLRGSDKLVFVPDDPPITVNPSLLLPGFRIGEASLHIDDLTYATTFGDPRSGKPDTYSRVRVELPVFRPAFAYSVKLLLPIICVVICASLMLLIRPTWVDARFGIGITALLTIVALQITTNEDLPEVDYLVLMDKVYIAAYMHVIVGLLVVVRTTRLIESSEKRAASLQRRWLRAITVLFTTALVVLTADAIMVG